MRVYRSADEMPFPSLVDFKATLQHVRPEVLELAETMSNSMSTAALQHCERKDGQGQFTNVESEALFIAGLTIALSIKAAVNLDSLPPQVRAEIEELYEERKRGN